MFKTEKLLRVKAGPVFSATTLISVETCLYIRLYFLASHCLKLSLVQMGFWRTHDSSDVSAVLLPLDDTEPSGSSWRTRTHTCPGRTQTQEVLSKEVKRERLNPIVYSPSHPSRQTHLPAKIRPEHWALSQRYQWRTSVSQRAHEHAQTQALPVSWKWTVCLHCFHFVLDCLFIWAVCRNDSGCSFLCNRLTTSHSATPERKKANYI